MHRIQRYSEVKVMKIMKLSFFVSANANLFDQLELRLYLVGFDGKNWVLWNLITWKRVLFFCHALTGERKLRRSWFLAFLICYALIGKHKLKGIEVVFGFNGKGETYARVCYSMEIVFLEIDFVLCVNVADGVVSKESAVWLALWMKRLWFIFTLFFTYWSKPTNCMIV